jgi:biopolymer transport protein ExbD
MRLVLVLLLVFVLAAPAFAKGPVVSVPTERPPKLNAETTVEEEESVWVQFTDQVANLYRVILEEARNLSR